MITVGIITLFPELFPGPLGCSIFYNGLSKGYWRLNIIDLKKYGNHIDDTIYGGGEGMLIRADILGKAIDDHINDYEYIIFTVPFGEKWRQNLVKSTYQKYKKILIICGRYEGIDYRIFQYYQCNYNVGFISIGDFIMAGGEIPAMVIVESILRLHLLRWNVCHQESFNTQKDNILLEHNQYTKPLIWKNLQVPEILLSGHHYKISQWRYENSLQQTKKYRPDLLDDNDK